MSEGTDYHGLTTSAAGPDFKLQCCFSIGDGTVQVTAGQTYSSWGWVYSLNGFTGKVGLKISTPFPSAITPSVPVNSSSTAEPDISISPPSSTAAGNYMGSITGTNGSVTHTIPITIMVSPAPPPPQGLVCFSPTPSSCPSTPPQFTAPVGATFTVYIVIQGSQAFNGFNIWFQYPCFCSAPGILNATGLSIQGSILPGITVQRECINGKGSTSCGAWLGNGRGIVALYANGTYTIAPSTGLLYSVTFQVTGTGSGNFGFFCTTNPSGPWIDGCADIFTNSASVNVQGASFTTDPTAGTGTGANGGPPPRHT